MLSLSALGNGEKNKYDIFGSLSCIPCLSIVGFFGSTEALDFAQTKLTPFGKMDKFVHKLEVYKHMIPVSFYFILFFEKSSNGMKITFSLATGLSGSACV